MSFGTRRSQARITNYLPEPELPEPAPMAGIPIIRSDMVSVDEIFIVSHGGVQRVVVNRYQRVPGLDARPWGYYPPLYTRHMAGVIELERDRRLRRKSDHAGRGGA